MGFQAGAFIHPGIPLTTADLDNVKSNLGNSPWSDGYAALLADGKSSTNRVMAGPFGYVNRNLGGNYDNLGAWEADMQAIFNLSLMWYYTGDGNYAQKGHDILIAWANTMTNFGGNEGSLDLGDYAFRYGVGADILRGTWPGWTAADTLAVSNLFVNVYLPRTYVNTNISTLGPANKGALSFAGALVVAVFNDDTNLFNHILYLYRSTASCGVHNNSLTSGEMGETGRDQGHSYNYLLQMAYCAEIFYKQGVDVYSEDDNRLLADGEYYARNNLPPYATFIPFGTIDAFYLQNSTGGGGATADPLEANILRSAYVVRKGLTAPWMVRRRYATPAKDGVGGSQTENANSFSFLKSADTSTAVVPTPINYPTAASVTSGFTDVDIGGSSPSGNSSYTNGLWTVNGGGSDIWTSGSDSCHFSYKALTGDCTVIAKVNNVQPTASNSRAGVMFRDTLSSNTTYRAFVTITPSKTVDSYLYGYSLNWAGRWNASRAISQPSYWVKLERLGKMINLYTSLDGTSWAVQVVGQYDNLPSTLYVGLVVCSEVAGANCAATFSNVSITGGDGGNITVPAAPYYVYASPDAGQVPLRWLTSFGASSYSVYRSLTNGGPYTLRASGLTNASYIDTGVAPNTTYYYVVTATNSAGVSGYSTEESVTTQPAPAPPAGLYALPGNGQATLLWAASSGATSYNVKRSTTSGSGYVTLTNVTGTSWVNTGLANGTTYYYVVSALGAAGEGTNSSEVSVTPGASATTLFWSGAVNGNWDTSTANWLNNGSSAAYQNGNAVIFDDSALSNATVSLSATLSPNVVIFNNSSKSYSINGNGIGGTCGITLFGSTSVALTGTNTFTGGVSIQQGATLMPGSSGVGSGTVTLNGGSLKTIVGSGLNSTVTNAINVGSGGATFALSSSAGNLTLTGPISGSGNVTIAPPGGILNSIYLNFSTNTVSGTITIPSSSGNNQTVTRIGAATAGSRYAAWSISGAQDRSTTLEFGTGTIEFGSLFGSASATIAGGNSGVHTMSVGALNQDSTFDGKITDGTGTTALTKVGSGTLTLTGTNTYTGPNNINAGKLFITTASQAKGNYTVASSATLSVNNATTGSAAISNLTLSAGSTIEFIDPASTTTPLLSANNVTVSGNVTVKIALPDGIALGTYPLISYSGSFSGTFTNLQLQLPSGISGTLVSNANQIALSITVIPVPAALTSLSAVAQGTQIELDWNAADTNYASGYNIWRSLTSGSGYTLVGNTTSTTYIDSGLAVNTTYYYVVTATNSFGSSANSPEASATTQPTVKWTGAASVNWDLTTTNWSVSGLPTVYQDGSSVWFDDTALSNVTINVTATMSPSIMVVSNSSKSYSFSGSDISGTGSLLKQGNGTLTFNAANNYSGGTTLGGGTLIINNNSLGSGPVTLAGGTFRNAASVTMNNTVSVATNTTTTWDVQGGNFTFNGNLTGGGTITRGTGATLSLYLGGDNSGFTGTFTSPNNANAVVRFINANAGSANAKWVFNQPTAGRTTLEFNGAGTIAFGSLTGTGPLQSGNATGTKTLSVGALGLNDTYSGVIANGSGTVALTKVGTGTMTLLGANTYTGTNNITAGKLIITTASLAKGVYLVASNATFVVTNITTTSATISNLIVAAGSALEFQRVTNTVTPLIAASNLTVNGSCTVKIIGTNGLIIGTNYPLVGYSGTFSGQFTNLLLQMPSGYGGLLVSNANLVTLTVTNLPSVPTNFVATAGDAQVGLSWSASSGAASYNVKRSTVNGGPYTTITNVTTTSYTDTSVVNGTTYYYVVSAVNVGGESANSTQASATPQAPPPATPTGLAATVGDTQVTLTWNASSGATSYNVKRSTVSGGTYTTITNLTATSYTDTNVVAGTTYYYVVSAVNAGGESANSAEASATPITVPSAPSALTAATINAQVTLSWSAATYASGYNVKRSTTSGSGYALIGTVTGTTYTDTGVPLNQTYFYVVTATNSLGESGNSPEASATPQMAAIWSGAVSTNWDVATANWTASGLSAVYQNGATARFDDTALSNVTINVSATVSPLTTVVSNSSQSYSFSGSDISGTGGLLKLGNGMLTLNVSNSYSGGTTLSNGTINFASSTAFGSGTITSSGGTIKYNVASGNATTANNLVMNSGTTTLDAAGGNWTINGNISGSGAITRGTAALVSLYLGGDNSGYTGTFTSPNNGNAVVRFTNPNAGSANASWIFNQPTAGRTSVEFSGAGTISFGSLTGSGPLQSGNATGTKTLSVGALGLNDTYSGVIANGSSTVALTKVGTGTMTLLGANTYTGTNNITAGKLIITTASLAKGVYLVASNATFVVTNITTTSATISNLVVEAGSALEFQRVTNTVTPLIAASNLTVNGSCTVVVTDTNGLAAGNIYPLVNYSGAFNGSFDSLQLQLPSNVIATLVSNANQVALSVLAIGAPAAPTGLAATAGDAQVALSWTASASATSYNVKRATVNGGPYTTITNVTATSYTDTGVVNGTTYYYVVSAVNAGGESANSTQASATPQVPPPATPTGLAATAGNAQVALTWNASSGAASYNLKRATVNGGPYTTVTNVTATSYTDTGVVNGTTYYYVVSAVNAGGESANSTQASATPQVPPPATPTGLAAAAGNGQVGLSWNASSGATTYNLKRSTTSGSGYTTVTNVTGTNAVDSGLSNGTTYYYVVSAVNAGGESANSSEVSVTPSDLIAYWKFNETSGTVAADSGGNGYNGTLQNGATWIAGVSSNAVDMNGTSQYVSLPSGVVSTLNDFSVSTFVKVDTNATWARVFDFGSGTGTYMFLAPASGSGTVRYAITTSSSGGEQQINSATNLSTGVWHHVAVTLSGTAGVLYIDGVAVATNSAMTLKPSSLGSTTQNYIGKSQWSDPYLNGSVDEFRIYGRALSASEVSTLAAAKLPSPWATSDVGTVAATGGADYVNGTFTIQGAGANIGGAADAFRFVYQSSSGDCSNTVRVTSIPNTGVNAKAGVMIRETLNAGALEAGIWVTPSSGIIFTSRNSTGGSTSTSTAAGLTAPYWVRIMRVGNSFSAYYSANGTSWTKLGNSKNISMSTSAYIGMGVCSGDSNVLNTATMTNAVTVP